MGVYENVKKALQDIVAPELQALRVEIKRLDEKIDSLREVEIKRLDEKIDSQSRAINEKIDSYSRTSNDRIDSYSRTTNDKIDSLRNEILSEIRRLDGRIDSLDSHLQTAIDIRERLAKVEARLTGNS